MTRHLRLGRRAWAVLLPVITVLMFLLSGTPLASAGQVVPVSDLLVDGERFAGSEITIEGELVGDYGFRHDGHMWTQLNDDSYARDALVDGGPRAGANVGVGIRMPTALGEGLAPVGGYRLEGPLVQATGVWRYHDPDRGGESYLDVSALTTIEGGRRLEEGPVRCSLPGACCSPCRSSCGGEDDGPQRLRRVVAGPTRDTPPG